MQAIQHDRTIGGIVETCYGVIHPTKYTRDGENVTLTINYYRNQSLALENDPSKNVAQATATVAFTGTDEFDPADYYTSAIAKLGEGTEVTLSA